MVEQAWGALHGVGDAVNSMVGYATGCVTQHPVLTGDWSDTVGYGTYCSNPQGALAGKMGDDTVEGAKATYSELSTDIKEGNTNELIGAGAVYAAEAVVAHKVPVGKSAKGLCSFAGSTPVLMADGSHKPIKDVEVGDEVIATDPETGKRAAMPVTHVWVHQDDLFEFEVDGELIVTTEDHPFGSATDQTWEDAQDLARGEQVLTAKGRTLTVTREIDFGTRETVAAYNLTVADLHTYHVGVDEALVHNAGGLREDRSDVPTNLGSGYRGYVDRFQMGLGTDFEVHVWYKKSEIGVFGSNGFFDKHGHPAQVDVPSNVANRLKGISVDEMRAAGRLGSKGTENIKGNSWMRPRLTGCK